MLKLKSSLLSLVALILVSSPLVSRADTLQLISAPNSSPSTGEAIYPYNFSVNGSNTLTSLACLNSNRYITYGETWEVTIHGLDTTGSSQTAVNYRADAYLFSLFNTGSNSNSDIQYAIWSIFDPSIKSSSGYTSGSSASLVNTAMSQAVNSNLIASGFFNRFSLYTPTSNQTGWTAGIPQEMIGVNAVAATPEPSSLMLLGTGLLGTCAVMRRRFSGATASAC